VVTGVEAGPVAALFAGSDETEYGSFAPAAGVVLYIYAAPSMKKADIVVHAGVVSGKTLQ
jgi:hypothetical protein